MKIIQPKVIISLAEMSQEKLSNLEQCARVCYQSEAKTGSTSSFLRKLILNGHESVIEHEKITVTFVVDRGVSNQIIRHRIASYSQESTRYCNYSNEQFGSEISVVEPYYYRNQPEAFEIWKNSCLISESAYMQLLKFGKPEEARAVLPTSLKTELVTTYNFREWRHFFLLRCSKKAHPQLRQVTIPLLISFSRYFPEIFEDIMYDTDFPHDVYAKIIFT